MIAAAAKTALGLLSDEKFLAEVRAKGDYVQKALSRLQAKFPVIKEVRGLGLMWGLELAQEGAPVVTGLPGTGPVAQLHPGQRHPAAAAADCRDG